jgi:hypothetical protein
MSNNKEINKKEILSLHKKVKTKGMVLREQSGDVVAQLQSFIDNGQVPGALGVFTMKGASSPNRKYAIKKPSKKGNNTFVYLFVDKRYGYFGTDGKFTFGDGFWKPEPAKPKEPTVDDKFKQKEIESTKISGGYKTKEELLKADADVDFTQLEKITVHGVDLFRPKSRQGVVSGVTKQQKEALAAYKLRYGAKEWDEMTPAEQGLQDYTKITVDGSQRMFGRPVELYVKSSSRLDIDGTEYDKQAKEYSMTEKECSEEILKYFDNFRANRPFGDDYFVNTKPKIEFCKNMYHNRWGLRLNSNKLNNILDLLSRQRNEYQGVRQPPSVAQPGSNRHKWYIGN